jgi:oxidase EvaA
MDSWVSNNKLIGHEENKFFDVIGVEIDVESREVESWDQPMIRPTGIGMCGLIFCKIADEVFCLVQVKYECGYIDMFELAPTIQFLNGRLTSLSESDSYLYQKFTAQNKPMHFSHQSEEGGRFFHEENACKIIEVQNIDEIDLPSTHKWVPLRILQQKIAQSADINIQLRTMVFILSMELSY